MGIILKTLQGRHEGVTLYKSNHTFIQTPLPQNEWRELEKCRSILFKNKMIGIYEDSKLGYGNISRRKSYQSYQLFGDGQFVITGTQTGHKPTLSGLDYTRVLSWNLEKFFLSSQGPIRPSSEAITHAVAYSANSNIQAIFHIHHPLIWKKMLDGLSLKTPPNVEFGTPEMAQSIHQYCQANSQGTLVMSGHQDGILIWSTSVERASELTLRLLS